MDRLRIGIAGVGHLGNLHAKMLAQIPTADFVGVYDLDHERARSVAAEHRTKAFESLDDLLGKIQALSIATVTRNHFDVGRRAVAAGVHLFIEKPITATIDEARTLLQEAEARGCKVQVGHIERFNPAILALEPYRIAPLFIESHRLAQFNPRGSDVAVVLDLMIHDIDLILSLVRSPVERIDANGVAVVSPSPDIANARLQFRNGCVANVTASRISQNKMRKMRLFQKDAYISIDFAQGLAEVFRLVDEQTPGLKPTMLLGKIDQGQRKRVIVYEQPDVKDVNALKFELEAFIRAVLQNTEPPVPGREGLQALEVAQEILQKIEQQTVSMA